MTEPHREHHGPIPGDDLRIIYCWATLPETAPEGSRNAPSPTTLRIVTGAHPDIVGGPGWLEHVAIRGDCVCGGAAYFRAEEDGAVVGGWLNQHANCTRKGDHG